MRLAVVLALAVVAIAAVGFALEVAGVNVNLVGEVLAAVAGIVVGARLVDRHQ